MLKKANLLLLICSILLIAVVQPVTAAESKTVKIKVTLTSAELVENDHVGNEWYTAAYVNGKEVQLDKALTLSLKSTDSLTLKAYAEEQDKIPDKGTSSTSVKASSITKTVTKSIKVTVVENRGRYSGNAAEWKFSFKIQKA
ncbi:hypothetical protein [Cohnella sp. AR92]|uniref:hypothetical protein n=1 Tax=Cohnella sp. AR92 TaxID=648716 RepID=UPI000F8DA932|nr:hypothetical protein [Cohnella sp. AR92]RUS42840.1 hypothetical protein ELR57_25880 [Cohnella sp. AR92]